MDWIMAPYLLGLLYFAANPDKIADKRAFRFAWLWFALIPASHFVVGFFGPPTDSGSSMDYLQSGYFRAELWANRISWAIFSISLYMLLEALVPEKGTHPKSGDAESGPTTGTE